VRCCRSSVCPSRVGPSRATLLRGNSGSRAKAWPASLVKRSFRKLGRSRDRISRSRNGAQRLQRGSISSRLILLRFAISRKWRKGRRKVSGERYKGPPRVTISPPRRTASAPRPSTSLQVRHANSQRKTPCRNVSVDLCRHARFRGSLSLRQHFGRRWLRSRT
jgi:hypothetical protein